MKATVVDLRYKMNDVLKALDRNEKVTVLYRGKVKGVLVPAGETRQLKIKDHPFSLPVLDWCLVFLLLFF